MTVDSLGAPGRTRPLSIGESIWTHIEAAVSTIVQHLNATIVVKDIEGRYVLANEAAERVYGVSAATMRGRRPEEVLNPLLAAECGLGDLLVLDTETPCEIDQQFLADGRGSRLSTIKFPIFDADRCLIGIGAVGENLTEPDGVTSAGARGAGFDGPSGLPNRGLIQESLRQAIAVSVRSTFKVGVILIDIEGLSTGIRLGGQSSGDAVMRELAQRFKTLLRQTDTLGRISPTVFCVIAPNLHRDEDLQKVSDKLLLGASDPVSLEGESVVTHARVGSALAPEDGKTPDVILHHASLALEQAKKLGYPVCRRFQQAMLIQFSRKLKIEALISTALDRGEFHIEYQPIIDCRSGLIAGAEALLRWNNPELGNVSPDEFISVTERNGLIKPIGSWVLNQVCVDMASMPAGQLGPLTISVNVSIRQLADPCFIDMVRDCLERSSTPPETLKLEITESALADDKETYVQALGRLRLLGVKLSLDDFGTGYSSLGYLQHYRFDQVKIDKAFVHSLTNENAKTGLFGSIVDMAHRLDLATIAEGVETDEQMRFVVAAGCEEVQGYLTGRPMRYEYFANAVISQSIREAV